MSQYIQSSIDDVYGPELGGEDYKSYDLKAFFDYNLRLVLLFLKL